jgi:hypothetical protein
MFKASMDNRVDIPPDSEDISAACFVPLQKSLIENATMAMYSQSCISMYWVLDTGKLISNSGFFPCLLLSAERQAHGPLVMTSNHVRPQHITHWVGGGGACRWFKFNGNAQLPLGAIIVQPFACLCSSHPSPFPNHCMFGLHRQSTFVIFDVDSYNGSGNPPTAFTKFQSINKINKLSREIKLGEMVSRRNGE